MPTHTDPASLNLHPTLPVVRLQQRPTAVPSISCATFGELSDQIVQSRLTGDSPEEDSFVLAGHLKLWQREGELECDGTPDDF